ELEFSPSIPVVGVVHQWTRSYDRDGVALWFARLIGIALLVHGIFTFRGTQAADPADCTGVVQDENGVPVAAAEVKLDDGAGHSYRTQTDGAGRFTFRGLLPGDYKAEVGKKGFFLLAGQAVTLHAGNNELSLLLNHEQEIREQVQVTAPSNQID